MLLRFEIPTKKKPSKKKTKYIDPQNECHMLHSQPNQREREREVSKTFEKRVEGDLISLILVRWESELFAQFFFFFVSRRVLPSSLFVRYTVLIYGCLAGPNSQTVVVNWDRSQLHLRASIPLGQRTNGTIIQSKEPNVPRSNWNFFCRLTLIFSILVLLLYYVSIFFYSFRRDEKIKR